MAVARPSTGHHAATDSELLPDARGPWPRRRCKRCTLHHGSSSTELRRCASGELAAQRTTSPATNRNNSFILYKLLKKFYLCQTHSIDVKFMQIILSICIIALKQFLLNYRIMFCDDNVKKYCNDFFSKYFNQVFYLESKAIFVTVMVLIPNNSLYILQCTK